MNTAMQEIFTLKYAVSSLGGDNGVLALLFWLAEVFLALVSLKFLHVMAF